MSPSELVRETALSLLADPTTGLNPVFVASCVKRQLPVPEPGAGTAGGAQPFDFSPDSPNLFRMDGEIEWLSDNTFDQYPCIIACAKSAKQAASKRPLGAKFFGDAVADLRFYLAWMTNQPPPKNNFETHLDALEEAVLNVLNSNPSGWTPLIYSNRVDFARIKLSITNESQLLRVGLQVQITALASV